MGSLTYLLITEVPACLSQDNYLPKMIIAQLHHSLRIANQGSSNSNFLSACFLESS